MCFFVLRLSRWRSGTWACLCPEKYWSFDMSCCPLWYLDRMDKKKQACKVEKERQWGSPAFPCIGHRRRNNQWQRILQHWSGRGPFLVRSFDVFASVAGMVAMSRSFAHAITNRPFTQDFCPSNLMRIVVSSRLQPSFDREREIDSDQICTTASPSRTDNTGTFSRSK